MTSFAVKCDSEIIQNIQSVKYQGIQIDEDLAGESVVKKIYEKQILGYAGQVGMQPKVGRTFY